MKKTAALSLSILLAFSLLVTAFLPEAVYATTDTITTSGSWVAPPGVTSVDVEAWGGGAGGQTCVTGAQGAPGGGGGAYSQKTGISVTPGNSYPVSVGQGGDDGINGGAVCSSSATSATAGKDSMFQASTTILAKGGAIASGSTGGLGGAAASGVGDTKFSGGDGGNSAAGCEKGGSGGGGAGNAANGGNAADLTIGCTETTVGTAGSTGGGAGGLGGVTTTDGANGNTLGGGGGGASTLTSETGGDGARGEVRITYTAAAGPNTCSYSGTGNWIIKYSDNCLATTTVQLGSGARMHIIRDGAGSFSVTGSGLVLDPDGAVLLRSPLSIQILSTSNGVTIYGD